MKEPYGRGEGGGEKEPKQLRFRIYGQEKNFGVLWFHYTNCHSPLKPTEKIPRFISAQANSPQFVDGT